MSENKGIRHSWNCQCPECETAESAPAPEPVFCDVCTGRGDGDMCPHNKKRRPQYIAHAPEAEGMEQRAFRIRWDNNAQAYKVSIPNYDGGMVVKLEHARAEVVRALEGACKAVCKDCRADIPVRGDDHFRYDEDGTYCMPCRAAAIRKQISEYSHAR